MSMITSVGGVEREMSGVFGGVAGVVRQFAGGDVNMEGVEVTTTANAAYTCTEDDLVVFFVRKDDDNASWTQMYLPTLDTILSGDMNGYREGGSLIKDRVYWYTCTPAGGSVSRYDFAYEGVYTSTSHDSPQWTVDLNNKTVTCSGNYQSIYVLRKV